MKNIVKNICQSDPAALKELWDALAPDVYKLAYSILRSEDDAKEITQMVFIKIYFLKIKIYLFMKENLMMKYC